MQKFFESGIISTYIKYLLENTPLPLFPCINENEYMVKGNIYIYKNRILKCTKSGTFIIKKNVEKEVNYLYPLNERTVRDEYFVENNICYEYDEHGVKQIVLNPPQPWHSASMIRVTDDDKELEPIPFSVTDSRILLTDEIFAKYEVLNNFTFRQPVNGLTQTFHSNTSYYDSKTHKMLGEYLRLIKNQFGLNLMSLYNCYCYEDSYELSFDEKNNIIPVGVSTKKTLLVPIKFNKPYTVALDCPFPFKYKGIIYNNGLIKNDQDTEYISNMMSDGMMYKTNSSFNNPFTIIVSNILKPSYDYGERYLQQYEKSLYLALEVPRSLNNTLTVLEGDYTNIGSRYVIGMEMLSNDDATSETYLQDQYELNRIKDNFMTKPSLLSQNDGQQHPFADKLISYLVRNTVDEREYINENISKIKKDIGYNSRYKGVWTNALRYVLYNSYLKAVDKYNTDKVFRNDLNDKDILGYLDSDIEEAIRKGFVKYGTR